MAVTVSYDQDCKMIISGVECSCGCQHHAIDKDIYIGKGLLPPHPILHCQAWVGHPLRAGGGRQYLPAWPGRR